LGLTVAYMFHQKFGLEVLASTPFDHNIELVDAPVKVGSTKHLPPTVSLQWYPLGGRVGVQPYVGAGVNYTTFFSEKTTDEFEEALGGLIGAGGPVETKLKLDDSWGLSAQAGIDVPLGDHWMLNAAVWYIDLKTKANVLVPDAGAKVSFDVDIDPWVYNIGIGYRF
jgi:outer membrane protein